MWIELLAFDHRSPDYGVQAFLDKTGFKPEAMLLFLYSADFLHTHRGLAGEWTFPPHFCAYAGRPGNCERALQPWTNRQLRGLIAALHEHGIQALCSVMTLFGGYRCNPPGWTGWAGAHPELMETRRDGTTIPSIFPLHRFRDGRLYEDFFCDLLPAVLRDYGFDGFHAADGYSSPRMPLWLTDYSDDLVGQFTESTGAALPGDLAGSCADSPARMEARAAWIWANRRLDWIGFYAARWERFCAKVCGALHAAGKTIHLNNAWTKDPFQALYRYGVDYARLARAGVDGFISENVGAGNSIGADGLPPSDPFHEFAAVPLLMKAAAPGVPIHHLCGLRDTYEQWDVLTHARPILEREIYALSSLRIWNAQAGWAPCGAGPVYCLSTDVEPDEWRWLRTAWERGYSEPSARELGVTVVWSDAAHCRQLPEFVATRGWTVHKWVHELAAQGAPVHGAARIEDLDGLQGPLFVANPHLLPKPEWAALRGYDRGPLILVGPRDRAFPKADHEFAESLVSGAMCCRVYGATPSGPLPTVPTAAEPAPPDLAAVPEPTYYPQPLYFRPVSADFLKACAETLIECSGAPRVVGGSPNRPFVRISALQCSDNKQRVSLGNDSPFYAWAEVEMRRPIAAIETVTDFPPMPLLPKGSCFGVRVPPHGAVVLDVTLA